MIVGFVASFVAKFLIQRAYGLPFDYEWTWALAAAGIGVGGGLLGALYPAVRAAGLDPVNALSYE
jgi:putative ABC transport system permease protein